MTCYLCGHTEFTVRSGAVRDNEALEIRECDRCGLVYLSSSAHIQEGHYEASGMHGDAPPSMESWLRETESDDRRRFQMLSPLLVNKTLLDFGCGCGGFLNLAQPVAANVTGVELERRVADYWGSRLVIHPGLDQVDETFDLVTAFHVVEHLDDPRGFLRQLGRRLAPGGRLVVEVPSSDDALLTLYESSDFQRFTYWSQHLYLFNVQTFQLLAQQAGLRVVAVEQVQRYPLSNHLHWLCRGEPGGHKRWGFLDSPELHAAYTSSLSAIGKCDTLVVHIEQSSFRR